MTYCTKIGKRYKIPAKKILREKWMSKSLLKCSSKCNRLFKKQVDKSKNLLERENYVAFRSTYNRVKIHARKKLL